MFSVVIPTRNPGPLFKRCLNSLFELGPKDLQIIVVFDGVVPPPDLWAENQPGLMTTEMVHVPSPGAGFCHAVNQGLGVARFATVQLLNDDAFVQPGWFRNPLRILENPRHGAVAPLIFRDNPNLRIVDSAGDSMNPLGIIRNRFRNKDRSVAERRVTSVLACSACAGFYRADALRKVGGFPEELVAYFDDVDVSFALRRLGYQIWFDPSSEIVHTGNQSYGPPSGKLLAMQSRNEELVFWRNMPLPLLFFMAIPRIWLLMIKGLVHLLRGTLGWWLSGKWQALKSVREIHEFRKVSQRLTGHSRVDWHKWPWLR